MGGSAFSSSGLCTPRMPRELYKAVKDRCQGILRDLYYCVASPIDGPAKSDFGDIDILLALPKSPTWNNEETLAIISRALEAELVIPSTGNECSANLAIPWPKSFDKNGIVSAESHDSKNKYIQVDVRVCPTLSQLHWMLFKHGHGDIWNILGSMIRPYGLTVDDTALWLRVPEIEKYNKKEARIFLSSEPAQVLSFLGLPIEEYWDHPFDELQDMYEYAARCRLMHAPQLSQEEEELVLRDLKSNDRRRMSCRPAYARWFEEFMPRCRQQGRFSEQKTTRVDVTREAFARFHVERVYNARREAFLLERQRKDIWTHAIKGSIPEPSRTDHAAFLYRSCLVKALKRIILEDDRSYDVFPEESLRDDRGLFVMDRVRDFIRETKEEVGAAAMRRHNGHTMERMRAKGKDCQSAFT